MRGLGALVELVVGVLERGRGRDHMGQLANGDHVVVGHLLAREHLGGGTHADDGEAEDPQYIGAKLFDERRNGAVEAVDDGGDGDDRHDADDDAEDGQRRAQLVGAQRVERHPDRIRVDLRHASEFTPQCDDRIEVGGFAGGVDAEEDADGCGDE